MIAGIKEGRYMPAFVSRQNNRRDVSGTAHYSHSEIPADIPQPEKKDAPAAAKLSPKELLSSLSGSLDPDRLLIAAVLILLSKEGADTELILALAYILL